MSHSDEFIVSVHERIKARVPGVPDQLALMDEPAGDFGIAHFLGVDREPGLRPDFNYYGTTRDGIAVLTFDAGYTPEERVVVHELGHALQDNTDGAADMWLGRSPLYPFWAARGLPGTPDDSDRKVNEFSDQYERWRHYAAEIFAECFAACYVEGYQERTQTYGIPHDGEKMRAFFASLRPNFTTEEEEMTEEEFERRFMEVYQKIRVAETFDGLKAVDAQLATDLRLHTHETGIAKVS